MYFMYVYKLFWLPYVDKRIVSYRIVVKYPTTLLHSNLNTLNAVQFNSLVQIR